MNTFDLGRILEEVHWDEYAEFDNPPHYVKSFHHRLRMRRIINQAVSKQDEQTQRARIKLSPRKIIILLVLIFTAIITAAAIVVWYGNIYGQKHSDNTELFAVVDGAPEVIEEVYELTWVPEGYEYVSDENVGGKGDVLIYHTYYCVDTGKEITFDQFTRSAFSTHSDIERSVWSTIRINGKPAVFVQSESSYNEKVIIFYDIGNYILRISACESMETVIKILKNIKII